MSTLLHYTVSQAPALQMFRRNVSDSAKILKWLWNNVVCCYSVLLNTFVPSCRKFCPSHPKLGSGQYVTCNVYAQPHSTLYAQPSVVTGFDYIVFPLQQVGGNASLIWTTWRSGSPAQIAQCEAKRKLLEKDLEIREAEKRMREEEHALKVAYHSQFRQWMTVHSSSITYRMRF